MYNEQWCSPGYACPAGTACTSRYCVACQPGEYTELEGADECETCKAGYYCPGATPFVRDADLLDTDGFTPINTRSTFRPILCPAGYYCSTTPETDDAAWRVSENLPASGAIYPYLCPIGTYGGSAGLKSSSECTDCPPGNYCAEKGALSPTGLCDAGYLCLGGSTTPRPYGNGVDVDGDADGTPEYDSDGVWTATDTGGICPAGGYCEIGSKD